MATAVAFPLAIGPMTVPVRSAREAVLAGLWGEQVRLLMRDYPYDSVMAVRGLGQGYAYLLTAMRHRGERLGLRRASSSTSAFTLPSWTLWRTSNCVTSSTAALPAPRPGHRLQEGRLRAADGGPERGRRLGGRSATVGGRC